MAYPKDTLFLNRTFTRAGIDIPLDDVNTLRRAERTLHTWAEQECGDTDQWCSWAIERDPDTEIPYRVFYPNDSNKVRRERIPDRERGALRRVEDVCERNGLYFYHQPDPRGYALYVSKEPIDDAGRNRWVPCSV